MRLELSYFFFFIPSCSLKKKNEISNAPESKFFLPSAAAGSFDPDTLWLLMDDLYRFSTSEVSLILWGDARKLQHFSVSSVSTLRSTASRLDGQQNPVYHLWRGKFTASLGKPGSNTLPPVTRHPQPSSSLYQVKLIPGEYTAVCVWPWGDYLWWTLDRTDCWSS